MDWQEKPIGLYLYICTHYKTHLWVHAQRLSNNQTPNFSDEEVLTLYLFGIWQGHTTIKAIYTYTEDHLLDWFPRLPSYQGYVQRLNHLASTFAPLLEQIAADSPISDCFSDSYLVDSFPCVIARAKWIEEKTGIQTACKVRSYNGLLVHIFGRLAAACFLLAFYS